MRAISPEFRKKHGNTGEALKNIGGRLTSRWDWERGQSMYDSKEQMADASAKYQADVASLKKANAKWAQQTKASPAAARVKYFEDLANLEKHWSREYARNLSLSGFQEHERRREQALQQAKREQSAMLQAQAEASEEWMEKNVAGWTAMREAQKKEAQRLSQVTNAGKPGEKRRRLDWVNQMIADRQFTGKQGVAYMNKWDADWDKAHGVKPVEKKPALSARARQVGAMFGLVPEEETRAATAPRRLPLTFNRRGDDSVEVRGVIPSSRADRDSRTARFVAATPGPVI
jgi:hypothetical protein